MATTPPSLLAPFTAILPDPRRVAEVIAPPYDVVSTEEARAAARERPWSFLHVSKPEIDFPPGTNATAPEVYARAGETMRRMLAEGVLHRTASPAFYAYRLIREGRSQTGVVAGGSILAYRENRIRRHELTRPDKEDDRVRQIGAVRAHTGPVFCVHRRNETVARVLARTTAAPPPLDAGAPDGVRHSLWTIDGAEDVAALAGAFDAMGTVYIADGHHRAAAGARVQGADRLLVVSFPDDEVHILDYNRGVRDLKGLSVEEFLARVGERFAVTPCQVPAKPDRRGVFGMYLAGRWHRLEPLPPAGDGATRSSRLDVNILADRLLAPVLGVADPRTDTRIDFVGGARGLGELGRRVDSGEMAVAFALYPTSLADLMSVADAGEIMPPKSTWFEPKLADGMVCLPLGEGPHPEPVEG
jgi:uncharacterized protein (DUF1015 family)